MSCVKVASFGIPAEKTRRWCANCAKSHAEAINLVIHKQCEGCRVKPASHGLLTEGKRRWCPTCAKEHIDTTYIKRKRRSGDSNESAAATSLPPQQPVSASSAKFVPPATSAAPKRKLGEGNGEWRLAVAALLSSGRRGPAGSHRGVAAAANAKPSSSKRRRRRTGFGSSPAAGWLPRGGIIPAAMEPTAMKIKEEVDDMEV